MSTEQLALATCIQHMANGLGGWPLPALADGHALHTARTKIVF
jgi:hypothetical protein